MLLAERRVERVERSLPRGAWAVLLLRVAQRAVLEVVQRVQRLLACDVASPVEEPCVPVPRGLRVVPSACSERRSSIRRVAVLSGTCCPFRIC